jgi:transmembrane sensor
MSSPPADRSGSPEFPDDAIQDQAYAWVVRHDRGLTAAETAEFQAWLRADERHAKAWDHASGVWTAFDDPQTAPVVALEPVRRIWPAWATPALAAAAIVALSLVGWWQLRPSAAPAPQVVSTGARMVQLSDGTRVFLQPGAEVAERFSPAERRVLLQRGEAHFEVAKNAAWPFVVRAGSLEVWAVGTAFNVDLKNAAIEVRVTEGRVRVAPDPGPAGQPRETPHLDAGQRAVLDLSANSDGALRIYRMDAGELAAATAWQQPLLLLGGSTLEELAREFQRRTGKTLTLADAELRTVQLGGRIPDDIEGFVWLLEAYGIKSERTADGGIVLRKVR